MKKLQLTKTIYMKTNLPQTPAATVARGKKNATPIFALFAMMIAVFAIYRYSYPNWAVGFYREKQLGWTLELKPSMEASYNAAAVSFRGTYRVIDDQVIVHYFNPLSASYNDEAFRKTPTGLKTFGAHFEREYLAQVTDNW